MINNLYLSKTTSSIFILVRKKYKKRFPYYHSHSILVFDSAEQEVIKANDKNEKRLALRGQMHFSETESWFIFSETAFNRNIPLTLFKKIGKELHLRLESSLLPSCFCFCITYKSFRFANSWFFCIQFIKHNSKLLMNKGC